MPDPGQRKQPKENVAEIVEAQQADAFGFIEE
jgi:hypothetical protein